MPSIVIQLHSSLDFKKFEHELASVLKKVGKELAFEFVEQARIELENAIVASGGSYSGRLSSAINWFDLSDGRPGVAYYEVQVDMERAPYAEWVEYGRNAGSGLPYSKSGLKDFSMSSFEGHHYIESAFKWFRDNDIPATITHNILQDVFGKRAGFAVQQV